MNMFEQKVIPDTIREASDVAEQFTERLREDLYSFPWHANEYRDLAGLPEVNVITASDARESEDIAQKVISRMRVVSSALGYSKDQLQPLQIYIDPTSIPYKNAYTTFYNRWKRHLWIKTDQKGLALDHELTHWATLGIYPPDQIPKSDLLVEGIATWLSWQIKDDVQKAELPMENYHEMTKAVTSYFSPDKMTLDDKFPYLPAGLFGAILFEVLYEKAGKNTQKIGEQWKTAGNLSSVSEWIISLGYSLEEITAEWKRKIFEEKL